jgi:hypothetical protein
MSTHESHLKTAGVPQYIHAGGTSSAPISVSENAMTTFKAVKMKRLHRYVLFHIQGAAIEADNNARQQVPRISFVHCPIQIVDTLSMTMNV